MPKITKKANKPLAAKGASKKIEAVKPAAAPQCECAGPKSAAAKPVVAVSAPPTRKVSFVLLAPEAAQVSVCGEFNAWDSGIAPLKRRADGTWETTLALRPGRYQYKFVVDGSWIHDPKAQQNVPNEHYSLNSVIEVCA